MKVWFTIGLHLLREPVGSVATIGSRSTDTALTF